MVAAFDTLSAAKALQAAGFEQTQAKALAGVIRSGQGQPAMKDAIAAQQTELGALRADVGSADERGPGVRPRATGMPTSNGSGYRGGVN